MSKAPYKYDRSYVAPKKTFKKLLDGRLQYTTRTSGGEYIEILQKAGETEKAFFKRIEDVKSSNFAKGRASQVAMQSALKKNVRKWSKAWLTKKLNTYEPREVDRFLKEFKEDWAAEVKAKGYKNLGRYTHTTDRGLPGLSTLGDTVKIGSFEIPASARHGEISLRKVFFENQLNKADGVFKKSVDDYFDFFAKNKSGTANQFSGKLKLPQGAKDAVFWLSPDSGVTGVARFDMFSKIPAYGKLFNEYQAKFNRANDVNRTSIRVLERKLGLPERTLVNEMRREHKALAKLFDVRQLPEELKLGYSIEHAQGLAAAVKSDNPNILKAARRDLAGLTWRRNMDQGWGGGGFELTRKEYIKDIQEGLLNKKDVTKDLRNLNKMVSTEYKDIGAPKDIYRIKNNKLRTSTISTATTPELRFAQYFSQLAKEKEGAKSLAHQMSPKNIEIYKPQLLDFIKKSPGNILMTIGKTLKCPVAGLGKAEGGRIGLAAGTSLINCISTKVNNDPIGSSQKISLIEESSGAMNKVKSAARGFLGALGRFGPAAGKYGAIAAAGALAQPLIKQFMNDDPSTYLTDPDQQAAMLEELIERQERTKPRSEILDTAVTGTHVAGTAAAVPGTGAVWKARRMPFTDKLGKTRAGMGMPRAALGPVGKFIAGAYTPAGLLAMEPLRIAQMRREGESWGEVAKSPTLWMGPAFADTMTKMATAGMKGSPRLAKALSLGMSRPMLKTISRRFGMPGLALSAGLSGYDTYKDWKNKRGWFSKDEE